MKKPPHPDDVVAARDWLRAGCPVLYKGVDTHKVIETLLFIVNLLPSLLPEYAYGTPEWRKAVGLEEPSPPKLPGPPKKVPIF